MYCELYVRAFQNFSVIIGFHSSTREQGAPESFKKLLEKRIFLLGCIAEVNCSNIRYIREAILLKRS